MKGNSKTSSFAGAILIFDSNPYRKTAHLKKVVE